MMMVLLVGFWLPGNSTQNSKSDQVLRGSTMLPCFGATGFENRERKPYDLTIGILVCSFRDPGISPGIHGFLL